MSAAQSAFRIRNDDGNETTATWMAALNTNTLPALDTTFRVRLQTTVDGEAIVDLDNDLYYTRNGGAKTPVTTTSNVVRAVGSGNVTNEGATTEQLAGANTFQAGEISEDGTCTGKNIDGIFSPVDTEDEFVIQLLSADLANGDVVRLYMVYNDGATEYDTYDQIPTFTISGLAASGTGLGWIHPVVVMGGGG